MKSNFRTLWHHACVPSKRKGLQVYIKITNYGQVETWVMSSYLFTFNSVGQTRLLESKYGGINNLILVGGAMTKYDHGMNFLIHFNLGTLLISNYRYGWKRVKFSYLRAVHGPCVRSDRTQPPSSAHCVPTSAFRHRTQRSLWPVGTGHSGPSTARSRDVRAAYPSPTPTPAGRTAHTARSSVRCPWTPLW